MCPLGTYCPEGSSGPKDCLAGKYCEVTRLPEPSGNCTAGYYCPPNSTNANAQPCYDGFYCPEGIEHPLPCPNGTYGRPGESLPSLDLCEPCDPGSYCNGVGRSNTSGLCSVGFYCPEGSTSSHDPSNECEAGYHCPEGSGAQRPCNDGFYQNETQQGSCKVCPPGFYCPPGIAVSSPFDCPSGHYCPNGTKLDTENPCPPGTFNSLTNRVTLDDCLPCFPRYYCSNSGQVSGTGDGSCPAGWYCPAGTAESDENICEPGHYCETGSANATACPSGTFRENPGNTDRNNCESCRPGKYCLAGSTGGADCAPGFICTGGSDVPEPNDPGKGFTCPKGYYCESGATEARGCPVGQYQDEMGKSTCKFCEPSFYCNSVNMTEPLPCPAGRYCEGNTTTPRCPQGTYSSSLELSNKTECVDCPAGRYKKILCRSSVAYSPVVITSLFEPN